MHQCFFSDVKYGCLYVRCLYKQTVVESYRSHMCRMSGAVSTDHCLRTVCMYDPPLLLGVVVSLESHNCSVEEFLALKRSLYFQVVLFIHCPWGLKCCSPALEGLISTLRERKPAPGFNRVPRAV